MIKNILFDLGGVIIDADLQAAIDRFRSLGLKNVSDYLNLYRQNDFFLQVEDGSLDRQGFNDPLRSKVGRDVSDEKIEQAWLAIVKGVSVEKLHWIERNRKNFRFYLLSNINPYVFEWANSSKFSVLGQPLCCYFDKMFASYRMRTTKPGVEIFQRVMEEAPLKPEETLFVDDGTKNVEAGKSLGFVTLQPQNGENWIPAVEKIIAECRWSS